tara:strand:- start:44 stop:208 length:165 start_codon:yes stop_codon:yes gene_type:complete
MNKKDMVFMDELQDDLLIAATQAHEITEHVEIKDLHANKMMDILEKVTRYIEAN